MANISLQDARQNEELATKVVDTEDKQVSAIIGLYAFAKLSEMMPTTEFLQFVNEAVASAHAVAQGQNQPTVPEEAQQESVTSQ